MAFRPESPSRYRHSRLDRYEVAVRSASPGAGRRPCRATGGGGATTARAGTNGFDHHMTKPADFAVLHRLLDEIASRRALDRAAQH